MNRKGRLCCCHQLLRRQIRDLRDASSGLSIRDKKHAEKELSYICIEALNYWISFIRAYYLSCTYGVIVQPSTKIRPARGCLQKDDALLEAARLKKPTFSGPVGWRDEPTWYTPATLITLATRLSFSNQPQITAAFSFGSSVFDGLPAFRNYYAHRNGNTKGKVENTCRRLGVPFYGTPCETLLKPPLGGRKAVLREWLDELTVTSEMLCG
jgi:hypothetical protein